MYNIFLQARLSSTRLPQKVLKLINSKPVILHILDRFLSLGNDYKIVIVTSENSISELKKATIDYDVELFEGSEENVLERFYYAHKSFPSDIIIRATADNLFVDLELLKQSVDIHIKNKNDLTHFINIPIGTGVEVINQKALEFAHSQAKEPHQLEHVTPYIYENKKLFKVQSIPSSGMLNNPNLRLTLDEELDFQMLKAIFDGLKIEKNIIPTEKIIKYLIDNPDITGINNNVKQIKV